MLTGNIDKIRTVVDYEKLNEMLARCSADSPPIIVVSEVCFRRLIKDDTIHSAANTLPNFLYRDRFPVVIGKWLEMGEIEIR
ncbi:MAG: hypothetical protein SPE58_05905 [Lactobacillus johnsonii]|nr:hypothetical protein [Lactobacillus johnsonii]